jgi:hypothetical protein
LQAISSFTRLLLSSLRLVLKQEKETTCVCDRAKKETR